MKKNYKAECILLEICELCKMQQNKSLQLGNVIEEWPCLLDKGEKGDL